MPARISRRTLLAGLAAIPAISLIGCGFDRTTAGPISTVDTSISPTGFGSLPWPSPPLIPRASGSST